MSEERRYYVRQDNISLLLTVLAISIFLYSALWSPTLMQLATYAVVLPLAGLLLSLVTRTYARPDPHLDVSETRDMIRDMVLAFTAIMLANLFTSFVLKLDVPPINAKLLAILMAIGEEDLFRGFFTPWLANRLGEAAGIFASSLLFAIYHFAVYGASVESLLVVFLAGSILSFIALKSRRITAVKLAHMLNNLLTA